MTTAFTQLATIAAERVLNAIPGGLLLAALAWLLLRVVGRQNSGTRFAVWFCALFAVASLPFLPPVTKAAAVTQAVRSEFVLPGFWAVGIFAVWMLIAILATIRMAVGLWKLRKLRNSSIPLQLSSLASAVREIVAQFQNTRPVAVCSSSLVTVPTAIGFFKPAILIPDWVLRDLSAEELKVVLLHEFAHLRRWDDWTNLAQKIVRTIFFFHPAVWWIERKLSLEREMACDEVVVAETANAQAYAECLVSLAEKNFFRRGVALAQAVVGHARDTSLRLARILDGKRPHSSRVFRPALGMVTVLVAFSVITLPEAPKLIAFSSAAPAPVVAYDVDAAPQATVIPAAMRTSEVPPHVAATRKNIAALVARPAKFIARRDGRDKQVVARPLVVRASAQEDEAIAVPQLLFVMQATHFNENGSAFVRLCVWHVTFDNQNRQTVREEMIVRLL
jgi:beta-lactamase regulating signal transducer with metallopeptidase domain